MDARVKIVQPNTPCVLFLGLDHLPYLVGTARGAFYALLKDTGIGWDQWGNRITFEMMRTGKVDAMEDQPALRSAHHCWLLPTVVVSRRKAFYNGNRKGEDGLPSIRTVYEYFKGVCQQCHRKVNWRDANKNEAASREHIFSVAVHGRIDCRSNILLMHSRCNSQLGHEMPKRDIDGKILTEGMKPKANHFCLPTGVQARDEWVRIAPWLENRVPTLDLTKEVA